MSFEPATVPAARPVPPLVVPTRSPLGPTLGHYLPTGPHSSHPAPHPPSPRSVPLPWLYQPLQVIELDF